MRKYKIILFLLFIPIFGLSQYNEDSLLNVLDKSHGKEKSLVFYQLSELYDGKDSVKTADFINKGIENSKITNDRDGELRGMLYKANVVNNYGHAQEALDMALYVMYSDLNLSTKDSLLLYDVLAGSLGVLGAYEMSIDYLKKLIELRKIETGIHLYYPLENIATQYSQIQNYDSADCYFTKARRLAERMNKPPVLMHCYNNMGFYYRTRNILDLSTRYYYSAIHTFENNPNKVRQDSILYALVFSNLADVYKMQKEYDKGVESLEKGIFIMSMIPSAEFPEMYVAIADLHLELNNDDIAKDYLVMAEGKVKTNSTKMLYYLTLTRYYKKTHQNTLAIEALESQIEIYKSNTKEKQVDKKVKKLIDIQISRVKNELELLQLLNDSEKETNALKVQSLSGGLILLAIISILLFYKYKSDVKKREALINVENKLNKQEIKYKEAERKILESKLTNKNQDLTDFAIDITRKHEFIKSVLEKLSQFKNLGKQESVKLKEITWYIKNELLIDDNLQVFQNNIDKINYEFMEKLGIEFPNLSTNEKQLCALLRLQLSSKEIATIKNISTDSVKTLRYRLRKKLSLEHDIVLNQYFKEFC